MTALLLFFQNLVQNRLNYKRFSLQTQYLTYSIGTICVTSNTSHENDAIKNVEKYTDEIQIPKDKHFIFAVEAM